VLNVIFFFFFFLLLLSLLLLLLLLLTPPRLVKADVKLNDLKVMVENTVTLFYPGDPSTAARAPRMLNDLLTQSWEVILANMK
jgi:hypothetical protein